MNQIEKAGGCSVKCGFWELRLPLLCVLALLCFSVWGQPASAFDKYVLGMSAAFTGPSDGLGVEVYRGAMAYFTHLNHQGGINGKMVTVQTLDDGYQPDPAIKNTIEFLEESEVLCLFSYVGTPTVTRALPLLKGYGEYQKLMFFPFTGAEPQRQPPYVDYVFNLRASYRQELSGLVDKFVDIGRNRLAVFYQVDAYGRSGWDGARRALAAKGLKLASEATYRRGAPFDTSMKQQVEIIMRSNPDAVLSIGSYAACAAFVRDARNMGLDVPIANVSFVGSENLLNLLVAAGEAAGRDYTVDLINTQVVPSYEDMSLPAVREYRDFMDRFMPTAPRLSEKHYMPLRYSFTSFEGFLNAKVMACILKTYDGNPSKGLKHAAESVRGVDLGIDVPVSFGPGRHQGLDRIYFTTVSDRKFVPIDAQRWQMWQK